jgi:hypothetical protein
MAKKICPLEKQLQKHRNYTIPIPVVGTSQIFSSANTKAYLSDTILKHFQPPSLLTTHFPKNATSSFHSKISISEFQQVLAFLVNPILITRLTCSNLLR